MSNQKPISWVNLFLVIFSICYGCSVSAQMRDGAELPPGHPPISMTGSGSLENPFEQEGLPLEHSVIIQILSVDDRGEETLFEGSVKLVIYDQFKRSLATWTAETIKGVARFPKLPDPLRYILVAETVVDGWVFTSNPIRFTDRQADEQIRVYSFGTDRSALQITDMVVVMEVSWEDRISVTETFFLENRSTTIYQSMERPIVFELPQGASVVHIGSDIKHDLDNEGKEVQILEPMLPVELAGPLKVELSYTLTLESDFLVYRRSLQLPTEQLRVFLPLETSFKRYPRLHLGLAGEGFEVREGQLENTKMAVLAGVGGPFSEGEEVVLKVSGWPKSKNLQLTFGLIIVVLIVIIGGFYFFLERGRQKEYLQPKRTKIRLVRQLDCLYDAILELEKRYLEGTLSRAVFQLEDDRLRTEASLVQLAIFSLDD